MNMNMNMNGRNEYRRNESSHVAYSETNNNTKDSATDDGENVLVMGKYNDISGWLIDSGATHHITNDKSLLVNYHEIDRQSINGVSQHGTVYAIGEGDVKLSVNMNGKVKRVRITSVWYVPGAQKNLLSVSALMDKECELVFKNRKCVVSLNGVEMFTAPLKSKLFPLDTADTYTAIIMAAHDGSITNGAGSSSSDGMNPRALSLWHRRMGHANERLLESMMRQGVVTGMDSNIRNNTSICEGCVMGKHAREPFRSHAENRSTKVLELVHTDVGEADIASWCAS
jgi:hypothetical protein